MPSHEEQKIPRTVADRGDRLDSWKEIAAFLGRGVRTVQRWEEVEGLPVRRHVHGRGGTVFAFKAELQKWYAQRQELPSLEAEPLPATPQIVEFVVPQVPQPEGSQSKWRNVWVGVGAAIVAVAAIIAVFQLQHRRGPATPSILISQIGRISQTVYSPNGDHIVYCWNGDREDTNLDLYVRDVRTGASRRLTSHPNNEHSAAWSPSGDRIAFFARQGGRVCHPAGWQKRATTRGGASGYRVWSRNVLVGRWRVSGLLGKGIAAGSAGAIPIEFGNP
jgi:hypothetical protein